VRSRIITSSICFFCEDIREEKSGADTLVGVLPDVLNIPTTPVLLPKLALYFRIVFPLLKTPTKISSHLQTPWQSELINFGEIPEAQMASAIDDARAQHNDGVRFNAKIILSPFSITMEGKIYAITSIDNTNILAGSLKFVIPTS
jgi:hypothetical protein